MLLTRDGLRPATSGTTIAEVLRAYARLPMDKADHRSFFDSLIDRVKQGRRVTPMPLSSEFENASREDYITFNQEVAPDGLAFVTAWDLEASLMIVKTNAGRTFLGKQRATYACFVGGPSGAFEAAGVVSSIQAAFGVVDELYRAHQRIMRAFD
ncbi:hypothetical protein [Methylobacterium nigriterrae]|uniref:hypothetical protein n=1 Tax=Methylobacterium nigriterrae TaxID=3127512 RepID=UPI0030138681